MSNNDRSVREIPYVNLPAQFIEEREELMPIVESVFARGEFVGGAAVDRLEDELANFHGVPHAIALNSGTDALILALRALGIGAGDEVITPPNSFVASTASIVAVGATPVFADVLPDQLLDPDAAAAAITSRTKAIMPVHLTGRVCEMDAFQRLAERHGLALVEDSAQSVGSKFHGRLSGTFGVVGCFSSHPLKNLNAAGDAGFLVTSDSRVAQKIRLWRSHGLVDRATVSEWGSVSRLDVLQAEVLRFRLKHLGKIIERRRENAAAYRNMASGLPLFIPPDRPDTFDTFHTFVVQAEQRDELRKFLETRGIGTAIHYPVPIHLQPAAASMGYKRGAFPVTEQQATCIVSLPINQFVQADDVAYVVDAIGTFYR